MKAMDEEALLRFTERLYAVRLAGLENRLGFADAKTQRRVAEDSIIAAETLWTAFDERQALKAYRPEGDEKVFPCRQPLAHRNQPGAHCELCESQANFP